MSEMAGEIVGAKLVLGIEPLVFKIVRPFAKGGPTFGAEISISFNLRQRGQHDQHVTGLFDWHLIALGAFAAAIDLAVSQRISAEIVRREGKLPARRGGVI